MRVLVIAPHPDDEILGLGGTINRLINHGHNVTVAIATKGWPPLFPDEQVARVRTEAIAANKTIGLTDLRFLDLPVTKLHAIPEHELNAAFSQLVEDVKPETVFLPFPSDRHEDHRQVFDAALVALRPVGTGSRVRRILCYETVSETHWSAAGLEKAFDPHLFVDIGDNLDAKLSAMSRYASQVRPAPDARSLVAVRSLAVWRGSVVGFAAAEAFVVVRETWPAGSDPLSRD